MKTTVTKWGNSLGIRLPKTLANEINLTENKKVELILQDGQIILRPIQNSKMGRPNRKNLDELLEGMTPDDFYPEIDFGEPVGNESW
jgi:antitoxin MazE